MTRQDLATQALMRWQELRSLPPDERIEIMMADFFAPPVESDLEYEITLRNVTEIMECA